MRKTVHKLFWAWEFDQEEEWLNDMSAKGLQLTEIGVCTYIFEEGAPAEYTYRLEFLENLPTHAQSVEYIKFLENTGIEHLGSLTRWVYFRKKTAEGEFDLFSNIDSRIKHLDRILFLIGSLFFIELFMGIINLYLTFNGRMYTVSGWISGLCLLVGLMLGYGCYHTIKKTKALKKERALRE